jgi:hypothetical protein
VTKKVLSMFLNLTHVLMEESVLLELVLKVPGIAPKDIIVLL